MRDYKKMLDWEYEYYKSRRKANPYRLWYLVVIIAWAILIVAMLATAEKPAEEKIEIPQETQEAVEVLVELPTESEEETQLDLAKLKQIENATITAYCICKECCGKDESHPAYGITASGRPAEPYVSVAVDSIMIPLGSTVYIDYGDGELLQFRADDTGSGVAGAHIDVCMTTHEEALEHGVQTARVYWKEE
jgi:3D (Asp-Asp-Asp) domain-containing protein